MKKEVVAYIDASNLKFWTLEDNWDLDYKSFRSWLRDKFWVNKAILFMWLVPKYANLYNYFQSIWYEIIFRPTLTNKDWKTKWNVDWELILQISSDFYEEKLEKAILVSWDWDYHCIVKFLKNKKVPIYIVSPNSSHLSYLLKKIGVPIINLKDFDKKLSRK